MNRIIYMQEVCIAVKKEMRIMNTEYNFQRWKMSTGVPLPWCSWLVIAAIFCCLILCPQENRVSFTRWMQPKWIWCNWISLLAILKSLWATVTPSPLGTCTQIKSGCACICHVYLQHIYSCLCANNLRFPIACSWCKPLRWGCSQKGITVIIPGHNEIITHWRWATGPE